MTTKTTSRRAGSRTVPPAPAPARDYQLTRAAYVPSPCEGGCFGILQPPRRPQADGELRPGPGGAPARRQGRDHVRRLSGAWGEKKAELQPPPLSRARARLLCTPEHRLTSGCTHDGRRAAGVPPAAHAEAGDPRGHLGRLLLPPEGRQARHQAPQGRQHRPQGVPEIVVRGPPGEACPCFRRAPAFCFRRVSALAAGREGAPPPYVTAASLTAPAHLPTRRSMYRSRKYNIPTNKYEVKAGADQKFWEESGWIIEQDPRGWFQWCARALRSLRFLAGAPCATNGEQHSCVAPSECRVSAGTAGSTRGGGQRTTSGRSPGGGASAGRRRVGFLRGGTTR